jgi:hypothetical protein
MTFYESFKCQLGFKFSVLVITKKDNKLIPKT